MKRKNTTRARGTGHLFRRGSVWYIRWRANGREVVRSSGLCDRAAAERLFRDENDILAMRNKAARIDALRRLYEGITAEAEARVAAEEKGARLSELADLFRNSPRRIDCGERQLAHYLSVVERFVAWAGGDRSLSEVDDRLAEDYARSIEAGMSPNTYNKHLNALAVAWDAVETTVGKGVNPWRRLPRRKLKTHVRRALTAEEVGKVVAAASGELRTLIAVGAYTGLRLGDCARLKWENVDFGGRRIEVTTSKTKARVTIPLLPPLEAVLREAGGGDGKRTGFVAPSIEAAYRADKGGVSKRVVRLFRSCGIETSFRPEGGGRALPDCGFHSLRHSFVSRAVEAGVPPPMVQAIVGHSGAEMTEHYTHVSSEAVLAAFANFK